MNVREKTKADEKRCSKCIHRSLIRGFGRQDIGCLYIIDKGESRGCDFGVNCTKFKKGPCVRRMWSEDSIEDFK